VPRFDTTETLREREAFAVLKKEIRPGDALESPVQ
jgi:hypothetical protein